MGFRQCFDSSNNRYSEYFVPLIAAFFMLIFSLFSAGCGGGGSTTTTGTVTGLTLPSQLSVVPAQSGAGAAVAPNGFTIQAIGNTSGFDPASAYLTDTTSTWVFDPSMESLTMVNQILCYVSQTAADEMVNQGAYIALINEKECEQGTNQTGGQGGSQQGAASNSGSSNANKFNRWVVQSTRADANSAQIVKAWIPGEPGSNDPMGAQTILVEVTVNSSPTPSQPFGDFVMNFQGVLANDVTLAAPNTTTPYLVPPTIPAGTVTMMGTLQSVTNGQNLPQFSFINLSGSAMPGAAAVLTFAQTQATNVLFSDNTGTSGQAITRAAQSGFGGPAKNKKYAVAFDSTAFLRGNDQNGDDTIDSSVCTSRTSFDTKVWRYNLYDSGTGAAVTLNSGFPFSAVNGTPLFGHIGYWGVWTENNSTLSDADVITRESYGSATTQTYTVNISNGKLKRRTKSTVTFAQVGGVDFFWRGDPADPFCSAATPCPSQGDYAVNIAANGAVSIVASVAWTSNGPKLTTITPVALNFSANTWETLWLWADTLGGNVVYKNGATNLDFFLEETVAANDAAISGGLNLTCYERCPIGGVTAPSTEAQIYYPFPTGNPATARTYTLSLANGKLTLTDNTAGLPVAVSSFGGALANQFQWGMMSGNMVTAANDPGANSWWNVNSANVSYQWETGPNSWNWQTTVTDNATSQIVAFDKPIQIAYAYDAGDDPNIGAAVTSHPAGNSFLLDYGGNGELHGFPWTQDDPTCDPATTPCRWSPGMTLKSGVLLGNTQQYIIKQIEREQSMQSVATSVCTNNGLDISTLLTDTTFTLPTTVSGQVSITVAGEPTPASSAPAVIEGVVQ